MEDLLQTLLRHTEMAPQVTDDFELLMHDPTMVRQVLENDESAEKVLIRHPELESKLVDSLDGMPFEHIAQVIHSIFRIR